MPFCCSKVEQVTTEDLVELSEIEKHNLGQIFVYAFNFDSLLSFTFLNLRLEYKMGCISLPFVELLC